MLNLLWHWLAQYLADRTKEDPGPLRLPQRVRADRVIIHQTADHVPSAQFGVGPKDAKEFDTDRWVGVMPLSTWLNRGAAVALPLPRVEVRHPSNVEVITLEV